MRRDRDRRGAAILFGRSRERSGLTLSRHPDPVNGTAGPVPAARKPRWGGGTVYNFEDYVDPPKAAGTRDVEALPDAEVSSFDGGVDPPYVTVKVGMRRTVRIRSGVEPVRFVSSNPS